MKRNRSPSTDIIEDRNHQERKANHLASQEPGALDMYINNSKTIETLKNRGIKSLFPIQYKTYNDINAGLDLVARDRTGSGKTLAYSLPVIERFRENRIFQTESIKMLVLLPTRQLAVQVAGEIRSLKNHQYEYSVALAFGGTSVHEQKMRIAQGCDILVATPGRLLDFMDKGVVKTHNLYVICLDEADEMLKMGFKQQVDKILKIIKNESKTYNTQTLLFSATLPQWIMSLCRTYLKPNHKTVNMITNQSNSCSTTIKHYKIETSKKSRVQNISKLVHQFIQKEGRCFIFCETKKETNLIQSQLGYFMKESVHGLHGDIQQQQRLRTFEALKAGKVRLVVATNVAARGLDIPNIQLVIQCSPPKDTETYIHRAGRTGRAGKQGVCVVLFTQDEQYLVSQIALKAKIQIKDFKFKSKNDPKQSAKSSQQPIKFINMNGSDQSSKLDHNKMATFRLSGWRRVNTTQMELLKYLRQVINFCDIKTKTDSEKSHRASIIFEVTHSYVSSINKLTDQFKTDGYYIEQVDQPKAPVNKIELY